MFVIWTHLRELNRGSFHAALDQLLKHFGYSSKSIAAVFLVCFLGLGHTAWTKSHEERGKEMGKKLDKVQSKAKEKVKKAASVIKKRSKELHGKATAKAHDIIKQYTSENTPSE